MGLSRTVSKIDGDFSLKSQNFPTPLYFAPPLNGFPWNWLSAPEVRTLEWWCYQTDKEFDDIFSHLDRMHERDRQTDARHSGLREQMKNVHWCLHNWLIGIVAASCGGKLRWWYDYIEAPQAPRGWGREAVSLPHWGGSGRDIRVICDFGLNQSADGDSWSWWG